MQTIIVNKKQPHKIVKIRLLSLVFLLLCSAATGVKAETKIALVIGNAEYKNSPLTNPTNDAHDISASLTKLGFEVDSYSNLDRSAMRHAIRSFGEKLKHAEVGLFYYAGHGIQINGRNYLVPLNTDVSSADEVQDESIDVGSVLRKMESAGNNVNIVILDACRNNPFARSFRNLNQGLARMDGPVGSYIAYATAPGSVAADGTGRNGIYTQYLLEALNKPALAIEQTFKRVRNAVKQATDGKQIPWESSSLMGEFVFLKNSDNKSVNTALTPPPAPPIAKKYLQVITNVPNAKVIINNVDRGIANSNGVLNVENILEDRVEVLVEAEGYKMEKSQITLIPNQWEQLNIPLTPLETTKALQVDNTIELNQCFNNKTALITTKVEINSINGKHRVKRNLAELKIPLKDSLTKYGLTFSDIDLSNSKKHKAALFRAVKRFKPHYLVRFTSSLSEKPANNLKSNIKTISGDMKLELINVKTRQVVGQASKPFSQTSRGTKSVLKHMLHKQIADLSSNLVQQVCLTN